MKPFEMRPVVGYEGIYSVTDDRRICLECSNVAKHGPCKAVSDVQAPALRMILMRCDGFKAVVAC